MAKLIWDNPGSRLYETGISNCVLFVQNQDGTYQNGVAWSGIVSITEKYESKEMLELYSDGNKYGVFLSPDNFSSTIEAYTYPDEFAQCDGTISFGNGMFVTQQPRASFAMCYKTLIGNDTLLDSYGYKIHIIYGCIALPSEKSYDTINDSPDAVLFSWDVETMPETISGSAPSASIFIDSTKTNSNSLEAIEQILYGTETENSRLPSPDEIAYILSGDITVGDLLCDEHGYRIIFGTDRIRV